MSNNQEILNQLPETEILNKKAIAEWSDHESIPKVLSISWNVKADEVRTKLSDKKFLNISVELSLLWSVFDSFGVFSPCLTEGKLNIQEL